MTAAPEETDHILANSKGVVQFEEISDFDFSLDTCTKVLTEVLNPRA